MIMMIKVKLRDGLTLSQKVPTIVDPGVDSTRYPLSDLKTQNFNQFYFHYFSCLVFTSVLLQDEKKKTKTKTLNSWKPCMDCSKLSMSLIAAISDISACISEVFFYKKMLIV